MASTSGDATPPSPKITRLMAEMIKLGDHMRRMSYDNYERMERMRKENKESLGRIHRSRKALSLVFLLMWFCRYFICIDFEGVVNKYCNFVMALTKGHVLALGPLLFSTLYQ